MEDVKVRLRIDDKRRGEERRGEGEKEQSRRSDGTGRAMLKSLGLRWMAG
jgi:hypothetical protein